MTFLVVRGVDLLAVAAAAASLGAMWLYLAVIDAQDSGGPAHWVWVVLVLAALLCLAAAPAQKPQRAVPLLAACVLLGALGVLAIFSIGMVFLLVACLAFCAFLRAHLQDLL